MKKLSVEHKAALKAGRQNAVVVRRYLDALELQQTKNGKRRKSPETIRRNIDETKAQLDEPQTTTKRLGLIQRRLDLEGELRQSEEISTLDISELEDAFVGVAAAYSAAKAISWTAWREVGVPAEVLRRGGLSQTRS